jgi:formylglycine-generating enzyme required for sulfatase activity
VNWEDAEQYVRWLSKKTGKTYRLPSEAEWEYAARAGTTAPYYWGGSVGRGFANCEACGSQWDDRQTAPVGSFAANPWGLYDMLGNVLQWTQDCYHDSYSGAPTDGGPWTSSQDLVTDRSGNCIQRVSRGGSWFLAPRDLRAANRGWFPAARADLYVGFRLARTN